MIASICRIFRRVGFIWFHFSVSFFTGSLLEHLCDILQDIKLPHKNSMMTYALVFSGVKPDLITKYNAIMGYIAAVTEDFALYLFSFLLFHAVVVWTPLQFQWFMGIACSREGRSGWRSGRADIRGVRLLPKNGPRAWKLLAKCCQGWNTFSNFANPDKNLIRLEQSVCKFCQAGTFLFWFFPRTEIWPWLEK